MQKIIRGFILVTCVTFFFIAVSWLGNCVDFLSPWKQAIESYKLTDFYFWAHRTKSQVSHNGSSIVTIDISSCYDRKEIAELINRINSGNPLAVAIDVIFPELSANIDKSHDDSLVNALKRITNLILAQEYRPVSGTEYAINSSFFTDEVDAHIGAATLPTGIIRKWSPLLIFDGDTIPSMTKVIADVTGIPMPSTTDLLLIDYSIQDDMVLKADEQWDPEFLEGQIVLVGDLADLRDTHIVPLTLKTSISQSGLCVHRQILQTAMQERVFREVPAWIMYIISFLILWALYIIKAYLESSDFKKTEAPQKKKTRFRYLNALWVSVRLDLLRLCIMAFVIICGYLLFWTTGLMFECKFLLSGFVLLYIFEDVEEKLTDWKNNITNKLKSGIQE